MYRKSGARSRAVEFANDAAQTLDRRWDDDRQHAEDIASMLALVFGRLGAAAKGEVLLRRAIESSVGRPGKTSAHAASLHRLLGVFLFEGGRFEESETALREGLRVLDTDCAERSLMLADLATLLGALGRHDEAVALQ